MEEDSVRDAGRDVDDELDRFLETTDFEDPQAFWAEVETKVAANRFRLLFVADRLSVGLVRIIEYLNEQMQTTEVVGVEILPHLGGGNANGLVRGRTRRERPDHGGVHHEGTKRATHTRGVQRAAPRPPRRRIRPRCR